MNVLLVITGLGMGGAEKVVVGLADALADKGHMVCIAYLTGAVVVYPVNANITLVNLCVESAIDVPRAVSRLRGLIRSFRPDVVHSHMVHANILTRLTRLLIPIPRLISTAHSSNEGGKLRMLAYRLTDGLADLSTNVSEEAVTTFIKAKACLPGRMITVHNGIRPDVFTFNDQARKHLRRELSINVDCRLILAVGRLNEAKDYPNLFHAIAALPSCGLDFHLCIAGIGPLKTNLLELAAKLGITNRVRFLGIRTDVAALMSAADVYVLSSAWEGFGLVVAEAMACERVVVATDCGGVREVLGDVGYLVRPHDSNALASALQSALCLSTLEAAAMGRAARQRVVERYSLDAAVEKWLDIYGKI